MSIKLYSIKYVTISRYAQIILTKPEKFVQNERKTGNFYCECDMWGVCILSGASMHCRVLLSLLIEYLPLLQIFDPNDNPIQWQQSLQLQC